MDKYAIILAAGRGTRMKTELPKCAYPFCGKPMVKYIVDDCKKCGIKETVVVIGYKKEQIVDILKDEVKYAIQDNQLGTGHAAMCCESILKDKEGICLLFPGDMPLVDEDIINGLIECHINNKNDLTVVTTIMEDPAFYGRIYRENGLVKRIIEYKDANDEQRKIKEINSGLYCVDMKLMFEALKQIDNNNKSNEYYFTDIIEILGKDHRVDSYIVKESYKLTGINDLEALEKTEEIYRKEKGVY